MNKTVKKVLLGVGISAAVASAVTLATYGVTKELLGVALKRDHALAQKQMHKKRQKLSGLEYTAEFLKEIENAEQRLRERDTETITLEADDGVTLVGHWYPCENAKRTIVAMHGWRSSWAGDFGPIADSWHEQGCHILFAEQRGQGLSGGEHMGFGLTERYDCPLWVNWVNERVGTDLPIYLAGISMGATTVLMASDLEMPDNVRGVIADCGFTSPYAIWKHVVQNNMHLHYGLFDRMAEELCKKTVQFSPKDGSAVNSLEKTRLPVLFIHGTDDHFVPVTMTYENYKACASPKYLLVVPGADHGMSYYIDRERYEQAVSSFWLAYDCLETFA